MSRKILVRRGVATADRTRGSYSYCMCERHANIQPFPFGPGLQPVGGCRSCSPRFISPQLNLTGNTLMDTQRYVLWLIPNPVRLTIKINHVDTFRILKQDIVNNWQEGAHIRLCSVSPGEDEKGQALKTSRQDTVGTSTSPDVFHSSHVEARSAME